jgi:hypothetical protein
MAQQFAPALVHFFAFRGDDLVEERILWLSQGTVGSCMEEWCRTSAALADCVAEEKDYVTKGSMNSNGGNWIPLVGVTDAPVLALYHIQASPTVSFSPFSLSSSSSCAQLLGVGDVVLMCAVPLPLQQMKAVGFCFPARANLQAAAAAEAAQAVAAEDKEDKEEPRQRSMLAALMPAVASKRPDLGTEETAVKKITNVLIRCLETEDLGWSTVTTGAVWLREMAELMAYIDEHLHTLAERQCAVPEFFVRRLWTAGDGQPQLYHNRAKSKKAKRNMRMADLRVKAAPLLTKMQAVWFQKDCWRDWKEATGQLLVALTNYADKLQGKNVYMLEHHKKVCAVSVCLCESCSLSSPVLQVVDVSMKVAVSHLPLCKIGTMDKRYDLLWEQLQLAGPGVPIDLAEVISSDMSKQARYLWIQV